MLKKIGLKLIDVLISPMIPALLCYFGMVCAGLPFSWRGLAGAYLLTVGAWWLLQKGTEQPS